MSKDSRTLNSIETATLMSLFAEIGLSIHAHVPLNSIQRHFPKALRGFCGEAVKDLVKHGYIVKHPTRGAMTYSLSPEGILKVKEILGEA